MMCDKYLDITPKGQSAKSAQSGCRIFETACSSASGARASLLLGAIVLIGMKYEL